MAVLSADKIEKIKNRIIELENLLIDYRVRSNAVLIEQILDVNFVEFTSSGKIYNYKPGDIFVSESDKYSRYTLTDFNISILSDQCFLCRYTSEKYNIKLNNSEMSLRSSIWKIDGNIYDANIDSSEIKLKILFHQGTKTKS